MVGWLGYFNFSVCHLRFLRRLPFVYTNMFIYIYLLVGWLEGNLHVKHYITKQGWNALDPSLSGISCHSVALTLVLQDSACHRGRRSGRRWYKRRSPGRKSHAQESKHSRVQLRRQSTPRLACLNPSRTRSRLRCKGGPQRDPENSIL